VLATYQRLHDVRDVEGFVAATIHRAGLDLSHNELEDLVAEGICILYELADSYDEQRAGYASAGRFSGFAAQMLPRKLTTAWHHGHREHRYTTTSEGKRSWAYLPAPLSLDTLTATNHHQHAARDDGAGNAKPNEPMIRRPEDWAPLGRPDS
jgi:hypothetical protein